VRLVRLINNPSPSPYQGEERLRLSLKGLSPSKDKKGVGVLGSVEKVASVVATRVK